MNHQEMVVDPDRFTQILIMYTEHTHTHTHTHSTDKTDNCPDNSPVSVERTS